MMKKEKQEGKVVVVVVDDVDDVVDDVDDVDDDEEGGEGEGEDAQRRKSNNPNLKGGEQGKATEHFHKSSKRHHQCRRSFFNKRVQ